MNYLFRSCQGIRKEQLERLGLVGDLAPQVWIEVTFNLQTIELGFSDIDGAPNEPVLAPASAHSGLHHGRLVRRSTAQRPLIEKVNGCDGPAGSPIRYPHDKSVAHYRAVRSALAFLK
jgi:hypothetical protein